MQLSPEKAERHKAREDVKQGGEV
ncbi:drug resistance MFS transporter EmrB/QacA subfamily [Cupriavidus sp. HMR-1]|nr:drug resistance MFS transporter EmrB/QacA subfamily [Cupriavidus sp. HMR-1]